jgi:hypothetical protein
MFRLQLSLGRMPERVALLAGSPAAHAPDVKKKRRSAHMGAFKSGGP